MRAFVLGLAVVVIAAANVRAELILQFPLEPYGWPASDIVIASRSADTVTTTVTIDEVLLGTLRAGDRIDVPFLGALLTVEERTLGTYGVEAEAQPWSLDAVRGSRLVVMLSRVPGTGTFRPANPWGNDTPSFFWLESGFAYAPYATTGIVAPRPTGVFPLRNEGTLAIATESDVRAHLRRLVEVKKEFMGVVAIADPQARIAAILPFISSDVQVAMGATFKELVACGETAIPALWRIVENEEQSSIHHVAAGSIVEIRGRRAGPDLIRLLDRQLSFFRDAYPALADPIRTERFGDHETCVNGILQDLLRLHVREAVPVVREFQQHWKTIAPADEWCGWPNVTGLCKQIVSRFGED